MPFYGYTLGIADIKLETMHVMVCAFIYILLYIYVCMSLLLNPRMNIMKDKNGILVLCVIGWQFHRKLYASHYIVIH